MTVKPVSSERARATAPTSTDQSSQRVRSRSAPTARRWRTTTVAIAMSTPMIVRVFATGRTRSAIELGSGSAPASRSTPGGRSTSSSRPLAGATTTNMAAAAMAPRAERPATPHRPGRNVPVGKISSNAATVMGRNAPKRLRNQRAVPTPARASSERMPKRTHDWASPSSPQNRPKPPSSQPNRWRGSNRRTTPPQMPKARPRAANVHPAPGARSTPGPVVGVAASTNAAATRRAPVSNGNSRGTTMRSRAPYPCLFIRTSCLSVTLSCWSGGPCRRRGIRRRSPAPTGRPARSPCTGPAARR